MGGHRLRSPLDAGARGAIYHLPDRAQHHALDSLGTVHTPDKLTLATSPTTRPKPAPNHTDQGQGQCELIFRGSRQTDTDACAQMWTCPLALQTCVHAHSIDVCAHEYVHECGHAYSTDVCPHECGHAHSTDVCARVWARPLYRRVCPCGHAHSPSALPPGSDRCGAALGRGPAPPLSQEPAPLGAPPALAGRGPGGPLCLQPRQQPSLLAASGATQEPMRPHGQTGKEGAPFLTERELVSGRQAGSKGRHPRTIAGTLTREASVRVSRGRLH